MAVPGIKYVQAVVYLTYEDGLVAQLPSAVLCKDIRHGLVFTDEEALVTMVNAMETVVETFKRYAGNGIYKYVRGLSAVLPPKPPPGTLPSDN